MKHYVILDQDGFVTSFGNGLEIPEDSIECSVPFACASVQPGFRFKWAEQTWVDCRTNETQWFLVREQRNNLLRESDWTQTTDSPFTTQHRQQWATYRQELRDITNQQDPFNIIWPTKPE